MFAKVIVFLFVFAAVLLAELSVAGIITVAVRHTCVVKFATWAEVAFILIAIAAAVVIIDEKDKW